MPSSPPLDVCILWHMHQPLYEDAASRVPAMPWVRLHALKDYYDMVALVREHPGVQVTFNLVPVLLDQIEEAARGSRPDRWLEMARKRPEDLAEGERLFLLESFFAVNRERVFPILPRLEELHRKARSGSGSPPWTPTDWRDLQVSFHLAWCGLTLRSTSLVRKLFAKGRFFTEQEKHALLDLQKDLLRMIIPAYRSALESGQVELSTSPYYHPILPLLCDVASAREASPRVPLPAATPRMTEDARDQLLSGIDSFTRRFGAPPAGVWLAEGALSEETLDLLEQAGVMWTATDEDLLHGSRRPDPSDPQQSGPLLLPYRVGQRKISVFFRDRILSDLIGFTYASWNSAAAAEDFVERLRAIAAKRPAGARGAVAVILDGENAWEAYPDNGAGFLDALYGTLERAEGLRAATFLRRLQEDPAWGRLERLQAGSWIHGDLLTWVGHPEKNRAWELLSRAREVFIEAGSPAGALRWLRAAQGSDWFWWYGDDHSSSFDATFDQLFRALLRQVHVECDREPPQELSVPIKRHPGRRRIVEPTAPIRPTVDGRVTDYFEWLGAGTTPAEPASAALAAGGGGIRSLHYGANEEALAFRVDPQQIPFWETVPAASLVVTVISPHRSGVIIPLPSRQGEHLQAEEPVPEGIEVACGRILEAQVPLGTLGLAPGQQVEFTVSLLDRTGHSIATFPPEGALELHVPVPGRAADDWSA